MAERRIRAAPGVQPRQGRLTPERETYRAWSPFGDEVWVTFLHSELPKGWEVQRTTTYQARCTRCGRMTVGGFWDEDWRRRLSCDYCD